jgi:hypothetical protein
MPDHSLLVRELQGSLDFFLDFSNLTEGSPGFGLTVDSTKDRRVASIAATGFALTAWVIGCERGWLPRQRAADISRGTLDTLLNRVSHHRGFFAHFLDIETAQRRRRCEYSTIDTALCLNGVITAAAYFEDNAIRDLAAAILDRVDWRFITFEDAGIALFRMAYNPDRDGDYVEGDPGFISRWDMAAEQKMMYLQAARHLEADHARRLYAGFRRDRAEYAGYEVIVNPGGTLFAYQFTEAWLDVGRYLDPDGVDWFENTRRATLADRAWCMAQSDRFSTYHALSWGASAGDSPWGYDVSGALPALFEPKPNGTVSIYSAASVLPFTPEHSLPMLEYLMREQPQTWGPYGFYDSYNTSVQPPWTSQALYGIGKGPSMIGIENYLSGLITQVYTESAEIQRALGILGFSRRPEQGATE